MGIRDFIRHLEDHRLRLERASELTDAEREETLLEAVIRNRRLNLPEEHAVRFAQDLFLHLRDEEERVKERIRALAS